jgi:serine/threonine protein kinase
LGQPTNRSFSFSFSLECLDYSSGRPFYYCAPNDVWSLGVILVNLTCGRNPWKQASDEDHTFRAFAKSPGFLKTILPITDELNDILGRIFVRRPEERITLPELRNRILACSAFTQPQAAAMPLYTPPGSPEPTTASAPAPTYVTIEDSVADDDFDYDAPLSPAASDTFSDGSSTCSDEDGSLFSDCSSPDDLLDDDSDDDLFEDIPEIRTPPPMAEGLPPPIMDAGDAKMVPYPEEFAHQFPGNPPEPMHMPVPQNCQAAKFSFPFWSDMLMRYVQPAPLQHNPFPFHQQVHMFSPIPGF